MQKETIIEAFLNGITKFPQLEPSEIWKNIHVSHVNNISKIDNYEVISKIPYTKQSWEKLSCHAFEEIIADIANPLLAEYGIMIVRQKELSILLNQNRILNQEPDIEWLRKQVKLNIFDLYLAIQNDKDYTIYGCVQSKLSINDKGTQEREESIFAMKKYFMSVAIVLDGNNLKNPIIKNLVNGCEFDNQINGWHGVYVLSNAEIEIDRIHSIDVSMGKLVKDVIEGAKFWTEQRQWFNPTWKPQR